jgi:hypothetical protein
MVFSSLIFLLISQNILLSSHVKRKRIAHFPKIVIARKDGKRLDVEQSFIEYFILTNRYVTPKALTKMWKL